MTSTSVSEFLSSSPSFPSDPPPSLIPESFPYDVFLSFRGIDTRNNFTSHLCDRLKMAGIRTFVDEDELQEGREISQELLKAIEESRIYIVVISQNYASSTWCLNELVKMIDECDKNRDRVLFPVFYHVQVSDVRWRKGRFEEAFRNHEARYSNQPDLVETWKIALSRAANFYGFEVQSNSGSESAVISLINKKVLSHVNPKKLPVAKHPVGLDSRVNDVHSLLRLESNYHVQFIGILGMGGSGKSVIAKALFNKLLQSFNSSCFLANVRVDSQQPGGLVYLQEYLISELFMREIVKVDNVDKGKEMIKKSLSNQKVLVVIDDTDDLSQVDSLAKRDWFSPGSIIIITTRNEHLLKQVEVDGLYKTEKLNDVEAMELFSWHSFNKQSLEEVYALTAGKVVSYSCGLPLALEVLGASLFGRDIHHWNRAVERLQQNTPDKIQLILKISYDGLNHQEKEVFLDIAFFFIGMDIDYVIEILNSCIFNPEIEIEILKERCLLTVDGNNELRMHDLLRDMGREIIWQAFPKEPSKRSRLWDYREIIDVLTENTGAGAVEGVTLVSQEKAIVHLNTENFARMCNLRLLQMDNVNLDGSFIDIFKKTRWISWQDYSLEHLPPSLQTEKLVALDMQHSKMITLWQGLQVQFLRHLKILNLSHSKCLISTPDFNSVPSLKKLILEGCTSLVQIHPSIGCLDSLLVLNLKGCEKIKNIPTEICTLSVLGHLNLSGCSNLKELPDYLGTIRSLRELYADETPITKLPASIGYLTSLSLRGCTKISAKANMTSDGVLSCLVVFNALERLILRDCNLSDEDIPEDIGWYSELRELDLAGNKLTKLPDSFGMLIDLESLWLDNWNILQSVPDLPPKLKALMEKNIS